MKGFRPIVSERNLMDVSRLACSLSMGRRPKAIGPTSSETSIRGHPVLDTTPDPLINHTYADLCHTFLEHHSEAIASDSIDESTISAIFFV